LRVFRITILIDLLNFIHTFKLKLIDFNHARFKSVVPHWESSENQTVKVNRRSSLGNPTIDLKTMQSLQSIKLFRIHIKYEIDKEGFIIEKIIKSTDYTISKNTEKFLKKIKLT